MMSGGHRPAPERLAVGSKPCNGTRRGTNGPMRRLNPDVIGLMLFATAFASAI